MHGIHHFAVSSANSEKLIAFYTEVLGFEVVLRGGWKRGTAQTDAVVGLRNSAASSTLLRTGNCFIELFQFESPEGRPNDPNRPASDHGYTHFCINVTDIDAEYERLKKAGVRFHCPPTPVQEGRMIRTTYARDPEGNIFELLEVISGESLFSMSGVALADA
jgi:catechol 2,3-dioxygenase-like lactoylglutathione lyase family enzyme